MDVPIAVFPSPEESARQLIALFRGATRFVYICTTNDESCGLLETLRQELSVRRVPVFEVRTHSGCYLCVDGVHFILLDESGTTIVARVPCSPSIMRFVENNGKGGASSSLLPFPLVKGDGRSLIHFLIDTARTCVYMESLPGFDASSVVVHKLVAETVARRVHRAYVFCRSRDVDEDRFRFMFLSTGRGKNASNALMGFYVKVMLKTLGVPASFASERVFIGQSKDDGSSSSSSIDNSSTDDLSVRAKVIIIKDGHTLYTRTGGVGICVEDESVAHLQQQRWRHCFMVDQAPFPVVFTPEDAMANMHTHQGRVRQKVVYDHNKIAQFFSSSFSTSTK